MGFGNVAKGEKSTAVGYDNIVEGNSSGAFGDPNKVYADGSYAFGNNNEIAGDNNFVLGSNVKIASTIENSVALGNNSTVSSSNEVSVGSAGNERTISNVKAADLTEGGTYAATTGQLYAESARAQSVERQLANAIGSNTSEIREVGAISAALAGLHFVEPTGEEGDKLVGAVAYGGYRGANAEAIGIAYKPNPNMMFSASTSISNGNDSQNAYNAGFSLKFGKGNTAQTRAELQKQVKFVNEQNAALKAENAEQDAKIKAQDEKIKLLEEGLEKLKKLMKK